MLQLIAPTEPKTLAEKIKDAVSFIKRAEKLAMKMQPDHGFWLSFSGGKDSVVIVTFTRLATSFAIDFKGESYKRSIEMPAEEFFKIAPDDNETVSSVICRIH